jgi:hypothetical protein
MVDVNRSSITRIGPGFFDLDSSAELYQALERASERYIASRLRTTEQVFFLVLGLTHLREWIRAEARRDGDAALKERAEQFFLDIFYLPEFGHLYALTNHAKHQDRPSALLQRVVYEESMIDDWPDFDNPSPNDPPPVTYHLNGKELADYLPVILKFYRERWFALRG